jgi:AraC family transcriptional activator of mtrCDE
LIIADNRNYRRGLQGSSVDSRPSPARSRISLNVEISENAGGGDRLDMLCGRFVLSPPHDRPVRSYLPATRVVRARKSHDQPGET